MAERSGGVGGVLEGSRFKVCPGSEGLSTGKPHGLIDLILALSPKLLPGEIMCSMPTSCAT